MADNTIALRVQQLGAEGVRARLREINAELKAGKPVTADLKKEITQLSTQVSAQDKVVRLQTRAWVENHQTLQTTARIMSTVGSVARSVLSAVTAISVASLAFGGSSSQLANAEADLARAKRQLDDALKGGDPEKIAEAQENVNKFSAAVKEIKDQKLQDVASSILSVGASIALVSSSAVSAAKTLSPVFAARLGTAGLAFGALGAGASAAAIPILIVAAAAAAVAAAIYMILTPGDQVAEFFKSFFPGASKQIDQFSKDVDDVFTMYIPNAFIFMANSALKTFNLVVDFSEVMVNGVIKGINAIISAVNAVASFLHLPTIGLIPEVSLQGIKANEISYLTSRNWGPGGPGTFNSGASASQPVMSSNPATSAGIGGITVNVNVNGDVSGEEVVNKVRDALKDNLIDRGFTGH